MFRRLLLLLVACVAPLLLVLLVDARPSFEEQAIVDVARASAAAEGATADRSTDLAEEGADAVEEDVAGFEPTAIRAPADPRERSPYQPCEVLEPTPLRAAVLTRPPA